MCIRRDADLSLSLSQPTPTSSCLTADPDEPFGQILIGQSHAAMTIGCISGIDCPTYNIQIVCRVKQ